MRQKWYLFLEKNVLLSHYPNNIQFGGQLHGFREKNLYHFSLSWLFNFLNSSKLVISFLCEPYFELIFHINGKKKFEIFFQILLNIYHCIANISQKKFSSERSFKKKKQFASIEKRQD